MISRLRWQLRFTGILALLVLASCKVPALRRQLLTPEELGQVPRNSPYLKAHLRSGDVIVLSEWKLDSAARSITGIGKRLDRNRTGGPETTHVVRLDSVALFESNVVQNHGSVAAMTVLTVGSAIVTVACALNPKACFGSCPTFYAADSSGTRLQAEGFSASVAPALEATDVDALYRVRPRGPHFDVRMTNEAQETHVVRWVKLLAAERPPGGRVYATQQGEFWKAPSAVSPTHCTAPEGDCLGAVRAMDDVERYSVADSVDLAAREVIELEFPSLEGDTLGLVIGSRQTLLSTYVLYQTLAYMGRNASAFLAALDGGDRMRERANGLARVLGGIEVQAQDPRDPHGRWKTLGATQETGPLATDVRVVVLKDLTPGTRRLRLRLTKGHWRIDYLALAQLRERVLPVVMDPVRVMRGQVEDTGALELLRDSSRALVTFPGDEYTLQYALPERSERYELFLESRGYYLEWMRKEWLAEENLPRAVAMLRNPARAMRELAPAFKQQEAKMEEAFWNSRYVRH